MYILEKSNNKTEELTTYNKLKKLKELLTQADAVVVGAGSGLSCAAGLTYSGERFEKNFADMIERYGMADMYSSGFYHFKTQEEKWAYWSRHIYLNRYDFEAGKPYLDLMEILKEKSYFVITTNVDHQFIKSGFDDDSVFATQGDYGFFQCAKACHKKLYNNEKLVKAMKLHQKDCKIPSYLVPKCPVCGGNMEVNLRCDNYFVEDEKWDKASERYSEFIKKYKDKKLLFIELGVGMNTPVIIKYPFWKMTKRFKNVFYVCINQGEAWAPEGISDKSICINADIKYVLEQIKEMHI